MVEPWVVLVVASRGVTNHRITTITCGWAAVRTFRLCTFQALHKKHKHEQEMIYSGGESDTGCLLRFCVSGWRWSMKLDLNLLFVCLHATHTCWRVSHAVSLALGVLKLGKRTFRWKIFPVICITLHLLYFPTSLTWHSSSILFSSIEHLTCPTKLTHTIAIMAPIRIPVIRNKNYKFHGLKSYVYALNKYGIKPNTAGPYQNSSGSLQKTTADGTSGAV